MQGFLFLGGGQAVKKILGGGNPTHTPPHLTYATRQSEPVESFHCITYFTGWLNGHHPATAGDTINGTVCFNWAGNSCYDETQIQIKHCTSYYLYYLVEPPYCNLRYCSTSTTLIGNVKTNRTEIL